MSAFLSDKVLRVEHVHRTLGRTEVLKDVSLSIHRQEMVSIMGPSGSGKTTLLYLMGALDRPSSGEIYIENQAISTLKDKARTRLRQSHLGFVFQFHFLLPELNACENVAIAAMLAGVPRSDAEQRARELLERVEMSHRLSHRPGELSGGEQQRVAIARALINRPKLVLADEPTGNLDTENTERVLDLLKELNQHDGHTIVLVTHNRNLAARANRQIWIQDGKLAENS